MRKIVFLWACLLPMFFTGCSDDDKKEDEALTLSTTQISFHADDSEQIVANKEVKWHSESDFVAEVDADGFVEGKHVGETLITAVTKNGEKSDCEVEVLPVYNTYKEPVCDFGASRATVKSKESRKLLQEETTTLFYQGEKKVVEGVIYLFENNKLTSAAVAVSFSKTEEVTKFLLERYQLIGEEDGMYIFINNDIKKVDMGIVLSVQDDYLLIMYVPYEETTKAVDSSDKLFRLRALFKEAGIK